MLTTFLCRLLSAFYARSQTLPVCDIAQSDTIYLRAAARDHVAANRPKPPVPPAEAHTHRPADPYEVTGALRTDLAESRATGKYMG
jgi:hypothetical protein